MNSSERLEMSAKMPASSAPFSMIANIALSPAFMPYTGKWIGS